MKIISVIKQVPDAEARIRTAGSGVDLNGVSFVIDGMDEYGVEEAIRLREKNGAAGAEIIGLALGPKRYEDAIRRALAMGLDRAIHIETEEGIDVIAQAKILAAAIKAEGAELVFVGGKEADWDSAALGPAVAEALGWPHADWVTKLALAGDKLELVHDVDDGAETLTLTLPAVITTQQGLNEPRYPTLPNIMKAKRKELKKSTPADHGHAGGLSRVVSEEIQLKARLNKVIEGEAPQAAAQLVSLLRDEAKLL